MNSPIGIAGLIHGSKSASFKALNAHLLAQVPSQPTNEPTGQKNPFPVAHRKEVIIDYTIYGLPTPIREHRFEPERRWRFDYAWIAQKVALEIDGGVWTKGRHTRGTGFINDMEKLNHATMLGWKVVRAVPDNATNLATLTMLRKLLGILGEQSA